MTASMLSEQKSPDNNYKQTNINIKTKQYKKILVALVCLMAVTGFTAQAQKKAPKPVVIELNFRNADDTAMEWPFIEKKLSKKG